MKAAFAGSFDPPTFGHLDLINRALAICEDGKGGELVVVLTGNHNKTPFLSIEDRFSLLEKLLRETEIRIVQCPYGVTLVKFLSVLKIKIAVRGIRNERDFEYETNMARINKYYYPQLETILLPARPEFSFISSSAVRELSFYNADISGMVPNDVVALIEKYKDERSKK